MSRKHDLKPSPINDLELTQADVETIKILRDKLSSESIVSYKFSEAQKKLMEAWYKDLLRTRPKSFLTEQATTSQTLIQPLLGK